MRDHKWSEPIFRLSSINWKNIFAHHLKNKIDTLTLYKRTQTEIIINKIFENKKTIQSQQLHKQEKMKNNKDCDQLDDHKDITSQLQQLEENINFISSSGNNFNQDERLVVVGIPRTKDNQRAQ